MFKNNLAQSNHGSKSNESEDDPYDIDGQEQAKLTVSKSQQQVESYWTRVISLNSHQQYQYQKYPISLEMQILRQHEENCEVQLNSSWKPHFDTIAFERIHRPLLLKDYSLIEADLLIYGQMASKIRENLMISAQNQNGKPSQLKQSNKNHIEKLEIKLYRSFKRKPIIKQDQKKSQIQNLDFAVANNKKYKMCQLKVEDIINIVHCVMVRKMSYQDTANQNHISNGLVKRIMNKAKKNQNYINEISSIESEKEKKESIVIDEVQKMTKNRDPIFNVGDIKLYLNHKDNINLTDKFIRQTMKQKLGFRYRRIKYITQQANSERNLIMRQQFAIKLLELMQQGKTILNIDETWLNEANFRRMIWRPRGQKMSQQEFPVRPRISIIAAISTEGEIYLSVTQVNTDIDMMKAYLMNLVEVLDKEKSGWRSSTVFQLDNASYHTSKIMQDFIQKQRIEVIYTGPRSYDGAPCELFFSQFKRTNLNPDNRKLGKKQVHPFILTKIGIFKLQYRWQLEELWK